jgi:hypothetical protein
MRRRLKWIIVGQFGLVLFVWLNIVLWGGRYFDSVCIEGRLSAEQAETVNLTEWGKCPKAQREATGCEAEKNDRVLKHFCSSFSRNLFLFDVTK